ncbi:hypothetical protein [uncultured Shewanella sp.]|uniref:hypothetical protein n=1 Tax=uncultured Shewanella sp. TaxID=173975 RepID=UPI00260EFC80|nr:hypothetical protein [uncultured Shewanella sp.]
MIKMRYLVKLREVFPQDIRVTVMADRGFGDTALFDFIQHELHFDFIIRIKSSIKVTDASGALLPIKEWLLPSSKN